MKITTIQLRVKKNSNMEIVKQDENESYSLFNNPGEEENISTEQLQSENKKLRKDLYEIKKLLKDLLDEI